MRERPAAFPSQSPRTPSSGRTIQTFLAPQSRPPDSLSDLLSLTHTWTGLLSTGSFMVIPLTVLPSSDVMKLESKSHR